MHLKMLNNSPEQAGPNPGPGDTYAPQHFYLWSASHFFIRIGNNWWFYPPKKKRIFVLFCHKNNQKNFSVIQYLVIFLYPYIQFKGEKAHWFLHHNYIFDVIIIVIVTSLTVSSYFYIINLNALTTLAKALFPLQRG